MSDLKHISTEALLEELKERFQRLESAQPKEEYTIKELSVVLGTSVFTLQRWCREGMPTPNGKMDINFVKMGREYVFTGEELRRIQRLRRG
jgi:hypothetical protein